MIPLSLFTSHFFYWKLILTPKLLGRQFNEHLMGINNTAPYSPRKWEMKPFNQKVETLNQTRNESQNVNTVMKESPSLLLASHTIIFEIKKKKYIPNFSETTTRLNG